MRKIVALEEMDATEPPPIKDAIDRDAVSNVVYALPDSSASVEFD